MRHSTEWPNEVTLKGTHVVLEPLQMRSVEELYPAASEREIWLHMSMDVSSIEDLSRWVSRRLDAVKNNTALAFLQRDAKTGEPFGSTSMFEIDRQNRRLEIGHTWIGKNHRGTVANKEAKLLLLTHAFERMNMTRVQIKTAPENLRSQKAIERLGATFEGRFRNYLVYEDGTVHDRMVYSIIREEWPVVKTRLRGYLGLER